MTPAISKYLENIRYLGSRFGTECICELLQRLQNPQKELKVIHVAGTNGKGSFCSVLSSILVNAGYRVGLYTSPFIEEFNERIQLNNVPIGDEELVPLLEEVKEKTDGMSFCPTEFDFITAAALKWFSRKDCDLVILEVGMGGRYDSTNVIDKPVLSVITSIALDHTKVLGDTTEKIAFEKAGIIKKDCPVIWGGEDEGAYGVIKAESEKLSAPLIKTDASSLNIKDMNLSRTLFEYKGKEYKLSLLGTYQPKNCVTVLTAVDVLREKGYEISDKSVYEGIEKAKWKARFELLRNNPPVIFDGGHNPHGIKAATESLKNYFKGEKVNLLMGVLADKDYTQMVKLLTPYVNRVFCITPPSDRALKSSELAAVFEENGIAAESFDEIKEGVQKALETNESLIILGSLYMYGEVVKYVK